MTKDKRNGFTLIELLIVIAIIGILAGMTFPAVVKAKSKVKIQQCKVEMSNLAGAINQYMSEYGRYPTSKETITGATSPSGVYDFTYSLHDQTNMFGESYEAMNLCLHAPGSNYETNNAEVIAILRDMEYYGNGSQTPNYQHKCNPRKTVFFQVKDSNKVTPSAVDFNGVYRDPWGNPYFISMDLNYDDYTVDLMYGTQVVSQDSKNANVGTHGLVRVPDYNLPGNGVTFGVRAGVMIWSMGPDGKADRTQPANVGVNKDNVLSWY